VAPKFFIFLFALFFAPSTVDPCFGHGAPPVQAGGRLSAPTEKNLCASVVQKILLLPLFVSLCPFDKLRACLVVKRDSSPAALNDNLCDPRGKLLVQGLYETKEDKLGIQNPFVISVSICVHPWFQTFFFPPSFLCVLRG
jgi:hypothetical protein